MKLKLSNFKEYRDVPSKVQYYLDILDADVEEHKEWLAAKLFPEFLEELLAEKSWLLNVISKNSSLSYMSVSEPR